MNNKKVFYFTNPTYDRHRAQEIRLKIDAELQGIVELDSPFYDRAGTPSKEIAKLDRGEPGDNVSSAEIYQVDTKKVRDAEGIVGFVTNKTSWGSIWEIALANFIGKPSYVIFDKRTRDPYVPKICTVCGCYNPNAPKHPFPKEGITKIFDSPESFIAYAKAKWGENNGKIKG